MPSIKNLQLSLNSFQLKIKEIDFPEEGITLLIGPNGAGKSSLAMVLSGLLSHQAGFEFWVKKKT